MFNSKLSKRVKDSYMIKLVYKKILILGHFSHMVEA